LRNAINLSARDYYILHASFGKHIAEAVNVFIEKHNLHHKVQLVSSHGHTSFHMPAKGMTAQLGDGATIAALTGINVVSDLRNIDVALGGQGAPIVPMGEKLLWSQYPLLLNAGGIANITLNDANAVKAFDICAANRVLNLIINKIGKAYDEDGALAAKGNINTSLLTQLNDLAYYKESFPKSLANDFGTDVVFPLVEKAGLSIEDALRTYVEHIAQQVTYSINELQKNKGEKSELLITGGGALNKFLVERIKSNVASLNISVVIPDEHTILYKEAIAMALLGVLRWREENTVIHTVTGASRSSIGGAVWIGQEA
jgi:anhydro-N-acetylmuramic acid kinase